MYKCVYYTILFFFAFKLAVNTNYSDMMKTKCSSCFSPQTSPYKHYSRNSDVKRLRTIKELLCDAVQ